MHPAFAAPSSAATPLHLVKADALSQWLEAQPARVKAVAQAAGFKADAGKALLVTDADGKLEQVLAGAGDASDALVMAPLPGALPAGDYALSSWPDGVSVESLAVGWADGAYRFTRYKKNSDEPRRLALPEGAGDAEAIATASDFLRDLINTPPADMGPNEIAAAAEALANEFGAKIEVTRGAPLESGYPMVHAVGKGAVQPPCLIEILWGDAAHPVLALVGKGVAFDTGGLNIKTGSNMALMKKDMGGAAHALALARLVMGAKLKVRLVVLVPAVENAIGPASFRPSDILKSRKGLTVEIEDTDAEGRLVLGDALTRASEHKPQLVIDFATLTGAARVALGPDLAPLYTDDDALAADIAKAAKETGDPVWRMPLWPGYEGGLKSPIADMKNLGDGAMGGSITAALFLKRFVDAPSWAHFDIWAWRPARYGRPAGAAACGLRAMWAAIKQRYSR